MFGPVRTTRVWRRFVRAEARLKARHRRLPRLRYMAAAGVVLIAACIPTVQYLLEAQRYALDAETLSLVGKANPNLAAKLTYDRENAQWQFNKAKDAPQGEHAEAIAALRAQAGGGGKDDDSLYRTDFPADPKKGVTFTDTQTELAFTMTPEFKLRGGKASHDGRLVYPMAGDAKLIYTAKNNGMKEDIVLPKFIGKELSYSYKLHLPKELTAKIQADGSVGIFSADPVLFGQVSTSSDMDAVKLKSAREQGEKNHLLFAIPAPVIAQTGEAPVKATARFGLSGDTLTVTARDMDTVHYPASVDPSVVVTSSNHFASGNNEDNIHFATDQIDRAAVTGGGITDGWSATGSGSFTARYGGASVAYNGYLYLVGGLGSGGVSSEVSYAAINGNGTVGSWGATTPLPANRHQPAAAAYNGKLYVYGGYTSGTSALSSVIYADINSNGSLGAWQTASTAMATAVCRAGFTAYDGYLYAAGGATGTVTSECGNASSTMTSTLQYAPILANGDVGAWQTSANTFTTARKDPGLAIYNDHVYLTGGMTNASTAYRDTQVAKLGTNGDIGTWRTLAEILPDNGKYRFGYQAYNGYLYLSGGSNNATGTLFAQILASGEIGPWQKSTVMAVPHVAQGFAVYGNHTYYYGGSSSTHDTIYNDTAYAKLDPPGMNNAGTTTTALGASHTATTGAAGFMHNGYLYRIGGYGTTSYTDQAVYAPINDDGTVGTWVTTSSILPPLTGSTGLGGMGFAVYGNHVYLIGGSTSLGSATSVDTIQYATFNSDGSLSAWAFNPTALPVVVANLPAVAYNGYVYMLYTSGGGYSNRMNRAPINSDGTLGAFVWDGNGSNNLPYSTSRTTLVVQNGYLYVPGGSNTETWLDTVQYAKINDNGTLANWDTTTAMPTAVRNANIAAVGGYLYVVGGEATGSTNVSGVAYTKFNSDGTLGTWQNGTDVAATVAFNGTAVWNDKLYIVSGRQNNSRVKTVRYITLQNGGGGASSVGATTNGTSLSGAHANGWASGRSFVADGRIYMVGGYTGTGSTTHSSVWYAPINSNGSVGSWTQSTSMNTARQKFGLSVWNGRVYVVGGLSSGGSELASVEYATLSPSGGVGAWTTSGNTLSNGRQDNSVAVWDGYLYSTGGSNSGAYYSDVQYAAVAGNGSVGAWNTTSSFSGNRGGHGTVAYGGKLYVLGGRGAAFNFLQSSYVAPIESGGGLGTWIRTADLPVQRAYFGIEAMGGRLYVSSGEGEGARQSQVLAATIGAEGLLSGWQYATKYGSARTQPASAFYQGRLYRLGGISSTSTYNTDVQYIALDIQPRTAKYSRLFDLGAMYNLSNITYGGTLPGGKDAITYRAAGENGVWGARQNASGLSGGGAGVCTPGDTRYVFVTTTLDDTGRHTLPDANSSPANLTSLSVHYTQSHAPTEQRLAHGKFFSEEALQPLDTCGG